jgi:hypothetical protein
MRTVILHVPAEAAARDGFATFHEAQANDGRCVHPEKKSLFGQRLESKKYSNS